MTPAYPPKIQQSHQSSTLREQAQRLAGVPCPYDTQALVVRRGGSGRPLFAVPAGRGDVTYAFDLAAHLDPDVPVYALPWPDQMPMSMEALAFHAITLMREAQPHGPYRVLGYSSGGLLAYAVAQHLTELDEMVEFVGLLDCDNPAFPPLHKTKEELAKQAFLGRLIEILELETYRERNDLREAVRQLEVCLPASSIVQMTEAAEAFPALRKMAEREQTTIEQLASSCLRTAAYETLWPTCFPQPLPASVKLHLFRATGDEKPPGALGWSGLSSQEQIQIVPVPGTHSSMIEPHHIGELGRALSQALRTSRAVVQERHAPSLILQTSRSASSPIVCVPGAGASVTSFLELGIALTEQTLVGMQPRGVDGARLPYGSVELAATRYIEAMHAHVPAAAPVHLLGHSFGGWIVFEMARQLQNAGSPVGSLTLVDVEAPDSTPGVRDCSRGQVIDRFLEAMALHVSGPLPIERPILDELPMPALVQALHRMMVEIKLMPARSKPDALRGPLLTFARACRTRYCHGTLYDLPVHLVLVQDTRLDPEADAKERERIEKQWRQHAADLTVWHGPGNHMTILDPPHVRALASWWRETVLGAGRQSQHSAFERAQTVAAQP